MKKLISILALAFLAAVVTPTTTSADVLGTKAQPHKSKNSYYLLTWDYGFPMTESRIFLVRGIYSPHTVAPSYDWPVIASTTNLSIVIYGSVNNFTVTVLDILTGEESDFATTADLGGCRCDPNEPPPLGQADNFKDTYRPR